MTAKKIKDILWDCRKSVGGLPCICDTTELHPAPCGEPREIAYSVIRWSERTEAILREMARGK